MNHLLALTLASLCVTATRGQSCQEECGTCDHLARQSAAFSSLVCILECEGSVSSSSTWRWCREAVHVLTTRDAALAHALRARGARGGSVEGEPTIPVAGTGGIVKRYGGFMRKGKKLYSASSKAANDKRFSVFSERDGDDLQKMEEVMDAALGDLQAVSAAASAAGGGNAAGAEANGALVESKRYGGFFRRQRSDDDDEQQQQQEEEEAAAEDDGEDGGEGNANSSSSSSGGVVVVSDAAAEGTGRRHEVEKRYGGFMRRLGRPSKKEGGRYKSILRQYMDLQEPGGGVTSEELTEEEDLLQQQRLRHHHQQQLDEDDKKRYVGFALS
ncbi:proenkephalin-A-like [Lethenteron reissneri]|uniref:proenkephalin-A-like n=1 Tax=Lethenteron reissneri TaxID=7753 RepID=UPI002AB731DC|nr:proenkephalin-A-like [Lethenteron reissneri]XP_061424979.1 proenkephalin-A-like [Lethenteron reissneri]